MRIFFIGSPRGNMVHGRSIYVAIEKLGHEHTTDFMIRTDPETFYNVSEEIWQERYKKRLKEIATADVCVFETSIHSLAVGQLIQEAINQEKPVVAIYYQGKRPHFMRGTEGAETRFQLIEYTLEDLDEAVSYALEVAGELLTTRFTMLMPSEMTKFLDGVSRKEGISKSEYIRLLIAREMKKKK